jgi:predicted DNA-binding antitoxin AbrB/MazE fold protein
MMKQIEAVYDKGMIRPLQPLDLPEGSRLNVIVISNEEPQTASKIVEILAEIAALPLEGLTDGVLGREHDSILYSKKIIECSLDLVRVTSLVPPDCGKVNFPAIEQKSICLVLA